MSRDPTRPSPRIPDHELLHPIGRGAYGELWLARSVMGTPPTLRHDLRTRGRLPIDECVEIGLSLTSALQPLHQNGLVHRDIKPSNIIFVNGQPKLADIGLVTEIDEAHSIVGTVGYLSSEGAGTARADLYSLGKVLYEAAFGKQAQEFPQLPADLPLGPDHGRLLDLNAIIARACASHPEERYHSAAEMGADLARLQRGQSIRTRRAVERAARLAKRTFPWAALVGVLGILLVNLSLKSTRQGSLPVEKASVFVLQFGSDERPMILGYTAWEAGSRTR